MDNLIMGNDDTIYYVVRVNGVEVSPRLESKMMAESQKMNLPEDQRMVAEVVPITADGNQLLLG